jgi:uncharacterized protein YkwD
MLIQTDIALSTECLSLVIIELGLKIAYGTRSARSIIMGLIIDDGVSDRGHRTNIFGEYSQVGIAFGPYSNIYETISVHNFLI